jgi:hypothetical protein
MSNSPLGRGKGRQALGWVVARGSQNPTPALCATPPKEGILRRVFHAALRQTHPRSGGRLT